MPDTPMTHYRAKVASGEISADPAQRRAVEKLQILHMRLRDYDPTKPKRVGLGFFGWGRERLIEKPVPGLYLYGGVGRGKSMLMDLFFERAPVNPKRRVHFHAFMQEVHASIHRERLRHGDDPVCPVADTIADQATLLAFDEMQITDITDAMLVGRLFERLFERGVVVVATSNRAPDELYLHGLNRHLFLPFIAMLTDRLDVHQLEGATDHRLDRGPGESVWFSPLGTAAAEAIEAAWERHREGPARPARLSVQGRTVELSAATDHVARVSFEDLCSKPLGAADYLALAERFKVLILESIPRLSRNRSNDAKRFVTLIDTLYEARVLLIASAEAEPEALYPEGEGSFEFARTVSRLHEMRSTGWPDSVVSAA